MDNEDNILVEMAKKYFPEDLRMWQDMEPGTAAALLVQRHFNCKILTELALMESIRALTDALIGDKESKIKDRYNSIL